MGFLLSLCFLLCLASGANVTVTVLADGFGWLENLAFADGSLFFSEAMVSRVWRLDGPRGNATLFLDLGKQFQRVLGLSFDPAVAVLWGVGHLTNGSYAVYRTPVAAPELSLVLIPALGNGLGVHLATGDVYTSAEGSLMPWSHRGGVYRVRGESVLTLASSLRSSDGLWIDQKRDLLYVGQLFEGNVVVWNISSSSPELLGTIPGLGAAGGLLDDFTLSADGLAIFGCNWLSGEIVRFPALPAKGAFPAEAVVPKSAGIVHPTSARWGVPPFSPAALYVTEGDPFAQAQGSRNRLLRIEFDS